MKILNKLLFVTTTFLAIFLIVGCKKDNNTVELPTTFNSDVPVQWADLTLSIVKNTSSNTPTYASRSLAYMGLAMYESVQNGSGVNLSMKGQLTGFTGVPDIEAGKRYNWVLALNASQAYLLKRFYEHTVDANKQRIDDFAAGILKTYSENETQETIDRSVKYGEAVASAIWEWSKTDGGYQGYSRNFPLIDIPNFPGSWKSPVNGQSASTLPLHPYWGENRFFVKANGDLPVPAIIPYSTDSTSAYYAQFLEVYKKNLILTQEEKEIATWWGDDPSETYAPPGHSYNLATIAIKKAQPNIFKAAETYARTGMAVAEAFINCWKCKYKYWAQRPASYVNANIDKNWVQFWPEPPFPAFTSGHATQSAAAATVLTDLYGDNFAFVDNTHEGRPKNALRNVDYKNRTFNSFWASAEESAYSRLLGGIHTRQDNEVGLAEGKKIGTNINKLFWKK